MPAVDPTPAQLQALAALADPPEPLVMLNLLRYHAEARYPDGFDAEPCSGRHAYRRYSGRAAGPLQAVGGEVRWAGEALLSVIAPEDEAWDEVLLVQYPSRAAFLQMIALPDYQAALVHRRAAVRDSRLVALQPFSL